MSVMFMVRPKGQTSTEYIILLVVGIVIVMIVVGLLGWFPKLGGEIETDFATLGAKPLGLTSAVYGATGVLIELKNNMGVPITITGAVMTESGANFGKDLPADVKPGGVVLLESYSASTFTNGDIVVDNLRVNWTEIRSGASHANNPDEYLVEAEVSESNLLRKNSARIFITSWSNITGNIGGVAAADTICNDLAYNNGLVDNSASGVWRAWLGTSNTSSIFDRIYNITVPVVLVNGTQVATDLQDLIDNGPDTAVLITEKNTTRVGLVFAYTAVGHQNVATYYNTSFTCLDWTSGSFGQNGRRGNGLSTTGAWTDSITSQCNQASSLYCIEQY